MPSEKIYVELLDEGTVVWRPVEAEQLSQGTFRITGNIPDDENWAFKPGDEVVVERHFSSDGTELPVAVRKA